MTGIAWAELWVHDDGDLAWFNPLNRRPLPAQQMRYCAGKALRRFGCVVLVVWLHDVDVGMSVRGGRAKDRLQQTIGLSRLVVGRCAVDVNTAIFIVVVDTRTDSTIRGSSCDVDRQLFFYLTSNLPVRKFGGMNIDVYFASLKVG